MTGGEGPSNADLLACFAPIAAACVSRNSVGTSALPDLIGTVHGSVAGLSGTPGPVVLERPEPAVPISRSVQRDYSVCLEDGVQLRMPERHLRSRFDPGPDDDRRRWRLPPDYPMVAPACAERRSDVARSIGLGTGVRRRS